MKLEVGKSYRDSVGNIWNVIGFDGGRGTYKFNAVTHSSHISQWFTDTGAYYIGESNPWDFVAEVFDDEETGEIQQ